MECKKFSKLERKKYKTIMNMKIEIKKKKEKKKRKEQLKSKEGLETSSYREHISHYYLLTIDSWFSFMNIEKLKL